MLYQVSMKYHLILFSCEHGWPRLTNLHQDSVCISILYLKPNIFTWDYESLLFSLWCLAYDFNFHLWNTHIFIATAQTFKAPDSNLTRSLECSKKPQNHPNENWTHHLSSQIWSSSRGPYFTEWRHPPIVEAINWSSTLTPPPPSSFVQLFTKCYWFHFLNCYWSTDFCIHPPVLTTSIQVQTTVITHLDPLPFSWRSRIHSGPLPIQSPYWSQSNLSKSD